MLQRTLTVAVVAAAAVAACTLPGTAQTQPARAPAAATATAAATAPGFIKGTDLPPHPTSPWFAGKVTRGLPEFVPFCLDGVLPSKGAWHRSFGTEYDTGASQISVRASSTTAARKLTAAVEKAVAGCAADWLRETPGGTASWQDYGRLSVEEGAHVYGVHTSVPDSEPGVHLYGIGRDGSTVTVVNWSQMGHLADAPVNRFKRTTTTAVNKLN
ncbi:hypothetical protein NLX86_23665 [Streptomyces sp. A3M-1-3]|uniref:hypothetical protein n=1 Tax=Streptomyces sp. A3M-1-3 TaxID=2962044 RepID=UPI0020B709EB|nr:hypothetical protein [Streptomyces sp. A3M-1-3]MCP3820982.1 hypothetical protein [Streptomyces sp. A3M-1-3]